MVDSIYRTRSLGVAAEGLPDQYADGKAAKVWEYYIGCRQSRTTQYKKWLTDLLTARHCETVLDVACGTGVDSIMLLEEGFHVTSTDASDKMLKYALKERWHRRKESAFDNWVIEEANWLSLSTDLEELNITQQFDCVMCLGNSFAHLPDFSGKLEKQQTALQHFYSRVKPGGILLVDHRNYDHILKSGAVPVKNVFYNSDHIVDVTTSNLFVNGEARLVTLDYVMDMDLLEHTNTNKQNGSMGRTTFRLSYYPHCLDKFTNLLTKLFGKQAKKELYGDFMKIEEVENPAYYIHVIHKPA